MLLYEILVTFFKIGALNFGGGYAMITLIEREVIANHHWLTVAQFADVLATIQMLPGATAVSSSVFVGYLVAGVAGGVVAAIGLVLPSLLFILLVVTLLRRYQDTPGFHAVFKGIRPIGLALLFTAAVILGRASVIDLRTGLMAAVSFLAIHRARVHPLLVIVLAGMVGAFW